MQPKSLKNAVPAGELPDLVRAVAAAFAELDQPRVEQEVAIESVPAVPVKKSVTRDHIICLEDGKKFRSLKRHLDAVYGMTPNEYRARWGLPKDYPMVAPGYSEHRSALARSFGLGRLAAKPPAMTKEIPQAPKEQSDFGTPAMTTEVIQDTTETIQGAA